jgi:hypothetical protein
MTESILPPVSILENVETNKNCGLIIADGIIIDFLRFDVLMAVKKVIVIF